MSNKTAIIIGAGPAGLTAAYELVTKTDIKPIIIEKSDGVGGLSKTVNYRGNRIDIGGHRFFSKSDRVMEWWLNILPIQGTSHFNPENRLIQYHQKSISVKLSPNGPDPQYTDNVMLVRRRISRIYYSKKFFDYPLSLNLQTIQKLGFVKGFKILRSYAYSKLFPIKKVNSLEDFFINRFGRILYKTFFKNYTEKVWGVKCSEISANWGKQRIKNLSVSKAIMHSLKSNLFSEKYITQKNTETSLIEYFLYPKYGPGQIWETVADLVTQKGGKIIQKAKVIRTEINNFNVKKVTFFDYALRDEQIIEGDYFFSTMPIKELIESMGDKVSKNVKKVSQGLKYRDFITVGLLLKDVKIKNNTKINTYKNIVPDNWIYIQEDSVKIGRLQIFNNWSPYMVQDKDKIWLGLEYFCNEGDELWQMDDQDFIDFAINELVEINIIEEQHVIDSIMIRTPKAYPAYYGTYDEFEVIRNFTDQINNLFLIGRNGMHKYNNQDHSMLTAMEAVENIISQRTTKSNIWEINTGEEYYEKK